jgi:beta-alanine--pyruvate transaminase
MIEFFHGYTYSGHPLAAAAGLATMDVYQKEGLFERALEMEQRWGDAIHSLKGLPNVIDLRNLGLIGAIELEPIAGQPTKRAMDVFARCFDDGLLIRTTGDTIALSPPLIIEDRHIERIVDTLTRALKATA